MTRVAKVAQWSGLLASAAFYVLSLALPALHFEFRQPLRGYSVLGSGWLGILTFDFAWFANPVYFLSLLFYGSRYYVVSLAGSGISIGLGLLTLVTKEWWFHEGAPSKITALGTAYYVWLASFGVLLLVSAVGALVSKHKAPRDARISAQPPF